MKVYMKVYIMEHMSECPFQNLAKHFPVSNESDDALSNTYCFTQIQLYSCRWEASRWYAEKLRDKTVHCYIQETF